jgi:hypothetical protein
VTEPAPEPYSPQSEHPVIDPERELASRNNRLGLALFGLALLLFAGTVAIGLVYLALD